MAKRATNDASHCQRTDTLTSTKGFSPFRTKHSTLNPRYHSQIKHDNPNPSSSSKFFVINHFISQSKPPTFHNTDNTNPRKIDSPSNIRSHSSFEIHIHKSNRFFIIVLVVAIGLLLLGIGHALSLHALSLSFFRASTALLLNRQGPNLRRQLRFQIHQRSLDRLRLRVCKYLFHDFIRGSQRVNNLL
jgi:hypothetical protein